MKVGFIGLGSMGLPMATNLLKAGHDLIVYNRTRSLILASAIEAMGEAFALVREHYLAAMARGWSDIDWAGLARLSAVNAGLEDG